MQGVIARTCDNVWGFAANNHLAMIDATGFQLVTLGALKSLDDLAAREIRPAGVRFYNNWDAFMEESRPRGYFREAIVLSLWSARITVVMTVVYGLLSIGAPSARPEFKKYGLESITNIAAACIGIVGMCSPKWAVKGYLWSVNRVYTHATIEQRAAIEEVYDGIIERARELGEEIVQQPEGELSPIDFYQRDIISATGFQLATLAIIKSAEDIRARSSRAPESRFYNDWDVFMAEVRPRLYACEVVILSLFSAKIAAIMAIVYLVLSIFTAKARPQCKRCLVQSLTNLGVAVIGTITLLSPAWGVRISKWGVGRLYGHALPQSQLEMRSSALYIERAAIRLGNQISELDAISS